ncbi:MAG: U32 family peptidase [Desulfobacteraceae bacterium]|nr:U32 family peptidase [Desulfobacteraceae bacterium]
MPDPGQTGTKRKPELLAPAGNVESFWAAVESGADAVYLGLKKFNARATASNFTLDETASLISYARRRSVRIYVTVNSLIAATEIAELLDTLDALASLRPDALIVQDAGVFYLARRHFPGLKLHASTLTAAHNLAGVKALREMGAERVVLARELSLEEIAAIASGTQTELEVFIHGALCYSYSGLCLTSSYRGGRSGLRGECVQPCRLKFRQGKKEGFFLSCNDLCALPLMSALKKLRIAGFKIEGRMKPAQYVTNVVKAYRLMLDADSPDSEKAALIEGRVLLSEAPARHLTSGHFDRKTAPEVLTPHRSGSSGIWAATVKAVHGDRILVELRNAVARGVRLRPESARGKEEEAFTASAVFDEAGRDIGSAPAGSRAWLLCSKRLAPGARLFKVGAKSDVPAGVWKRIAEDGPRPGRVKRNPGGMRRILEDLGVALPGGSKQPERLIVKVGSASDLVPALQSSAALVLLSGTRGNLERIARQRFSNFQMRKLGISLPPLLSEDKDAEYYAAAVKWFVGKGFRLWECNNWAHFELLRGGEDLRMIAGARLNLRNPAALLESMELGCKMSVLSLEVTRDELVSLSGQWAQSVAVSVYSWPPLFVSRLIPDLAEGRPILTPRDDAYLLKREAGLACIYADRPVSWLEQLSFLRDLGYRNFVADLSEGPEKRQPTLNGLLAGFGSERSPIPGSTFNFDRRIV